MEHPDPERSESFAGGSVTDPAADPTPSGQLARRFWAGSPLNVVVHGPGPVTELAALVQDRAPQLRGQPTDDLGLLHLVRDERAYAAVFVTSQTGSAFVLSDITTPPDGDTSALRALFPVGDHLGVPQVTADGTGHWRTSLFGHGTTDDWAVADVLRAGRVVPITEFTGFVVDGPTADAPADAPGDAPAGAPAEQPPAGASVSDALADELIAAGWQVQEPSTPPSAGPPHLLLGTIREQRPVFFGARHDGWARWACPVTTDPVRAANIRTAPPDLPDPVTLHLPTPERPDSVLLELQLPVDAVATTIDVEQAAVGLVRLAAAIDDAAAPGSAN